MVAAPWGARMGMGAQLPAPGQLQWVLVQPQRGCLSPALLGLGTVPASPQAPGAGCTELCGRGAARSSWPWERCPGLQPCWRDVSNRGMCPVLGLLLCFRVAW